MVLFFGGLPNKIKVASRPVKVVLRYAVQEDTGVLTQMPKTQLLILVQSKVVRSLVTVSVMCYSTFKFAITTMAIVAS